MTTFDSTFYPLADEMLKEFGKIATYKEILAGVLDNDTQTVVNGENNYSIHIYPYSVDSGDITSGLASADDVKLLVSAKELSITPKVGDKIISDKTYEIKRIIPTYSGELIATYDFIGVIR